MNKYICFFLLGIIVNCTYASKQNILSDKNCFNSSNRLATLNKQDTIKGNDNTYVVRTYAKRKTLLSSVSYKSFRPDIRHGKAVSYFSNGVHEWDGQFRNNFPVGKWTIRNKKGEIIKELDYTKAHDSFMKLSDDSVCQITDVVARYTGTSFIEYISNSIYYSPFIKRKGKSGRILISFIVDELGKVYSTRLKNVGASKDVNFEVLRLVIDSPKWEPALLNGKPVKQEVTIDISIFDDNKIISHTSSVNIYTPIDNDSEAIYFVLEEPATFQDKELEDVIIFFQNKLSKEKLDYKGNLFIQFIIDKNGEIKNIDFSKSPYLNKDDIDLIVDMLLGCPKWKPAKNNGKSVNQQFIIAITL